MSDQKHEIATLGGGCFWCTEAAFDQLDGVMHVESGYTGGHVASPTYEQVCSGGTGHVEVVRVTYDSAILSFRDILKVFFTVHDPTTLNRQGADVGSQYRSAIFYQDEEQREISQRLIAELQEEGIWDDAIVTEVIPAEAFYPAEAYHRDYYRRHPDQAYCQVVIAPKLAKLRQTHAHRLRRAPEAGSSEADPVRSYQSEPRNAVDHGGIAE